MAKIFKSTACIALFLKQIGFYTDYETTSHCFTGDKSKVVKSRFVNSHIEAYRLNL